MVGSPRSRSLRLLLAAVTAAFLTLAACSQDADESPEQEADTVLVAPGTACDRDAATDEAQTINEQVGGLRNADFTVRFSQSTKLGNVALVTGDTEKAFRVLSEDYGVAVVALLDDAESEGIVGFEQIRTLVEDICKAA